ncbi:hypothetical protein DLE60_27700 [Micromonospora globispora]|nr:hypothetical protein DLE60_27700 [Micromonospora globispora]RQW91795.1 hypothetical protein DKL51_20070 [Micromonospora globispora]
MGPAKETDDRYLTRSDGHTARAGREPAVDHHVEDLHAVDGTPVIDIKPWFTAMGPRGEIREPQWDPRYAAP